MHATLAAIFDASYGSWLLFLLWANRDIKRRATVERFQGFPGHPLDTAPSSPLPPSFQSKRSLCMMSAAPAGAIAALRDPASKSKEEVGLHSYFAGTERSIPPLVDIPPELISLVLHGGLSPQGGHKPACGWLSPRCSGLQRRVSLVPPATWAGRHAGRHAMLSLARCSFPPAPWEPVLSLAATPPVLPCIALHCRSRRSV